jgi:rSAM/selenodomain-associated transferase 2
VIFSVILPTWNEEREIGAAIASVRTARPDVEILVADGGSTDATREIAAGAGATVLSSAPGRAVQQNAGAAAAAGEVLVFLHADCRFPSAGFDQIERALKDVRVIAGGFRQRIDAPGPGYRLIEWGNGLRARWRGSIYGDQGLFIRRTAFDQAGGFPVVPLLEDWLLSQTLRKQGRLALCAGPLMVSPRRWQQEGLVKRTWKNWSILRRARAGVSIEELAREYRNVR